MKYTMESNIPHKRIRLQNGKMCEEESHNQK